MLKQEIINIFLNLGFTSSNHPNLGILIELDPIDAFTLSSIVGSPYLIDQNGVTMKGRSEVFIHRSVFQNGYYIYSPGLFSRDIKGKLREGNSAEVLLRKHPSVFNNKKYLIIQDIKINESSNIERKTFEYISQYEDPKDFLLFKNYENGSSLEPFYEYLASLTFISKGYLTENQVPWFQQNYKYKGEALNGGIPDFSAFHSSISNKLFEYGIITDNLGIALNMLPVYHNFRNKNKQSNNKKEFKYELILGEAKTSKFSTEPANKQLLKYSQVELANKLFTIIPDCKDNGTKEFGTIYLENNIVKMNPPSIQVVISTQQQEIDKEWIDNYVKVLLLGNVPFNRIIDFISNYRTQTKQEILEEYEAVHLLDAVLMTTNEKYFEFLENYL